MVAMVCAPVFYVAMFVVAMFAYRFKLKSRVGYTVFGEFFSHFFFYSVRVAVGYNVHCSVKVMPVKCAQMYMVRVSNAVNLAYMIFNFIYRNVAWSFLEKNIQNRF